MPPDWDSIGFVISSKYRLAVLESLDRSPATPTEIAANEELPPTHVSRALRRLRGQSLVRLAVPEDTHKDRRYDLTPEGETTWQAIRTHGLCD